MTNLRHACLPLIVACSLLAGCANPFVEHYRGERWPTTRSAEVVLETPPSSDVRWIGHSTFDSFDPVSSAQAIAAAEALYGAWLCGTVLGTVGMALHHKICHTHDCAYG